MRAKTDISPKFDRLIDSANNPFKLGIFGGTFDPIHVGHLHIAQFALEQYRLDGVIFMPTGNPVRKLASGYSEATHRYNMVKLVTDSNPAFDTTNLEMRRGGHTFTIDSIQAISERYGSKAELYFIAGLDSVSDMHTWKDGARLAKMMTVICANRSEGKQDLDAKAQNMTSKNMGFDIQYIDTFSLDVSSRALREALRAGRSCKYLIPSNVREYIKEHGLYK